MKTWAWSAAAATTILKSEPGAYSPWIARLRSGRSGSWTRAEPRLAVDPPREALDGERRVRDQGEHVAVPRIEDDDRAVPGAERLLGGLLDAAVDRRVDVGARQRLLPMQDADRAAVGVDLDLLGAVPAPQMLVVEPLEPRLAHQVAPPEAPAARGRRPRPPGRSRAGGRRSASTGRCAGTRPRWSRPAARASIPPAARSRRASAPARAGPATGSRAGPSRTARGARRPGCPMRLDRRSRTAGRSSASRGTRASVKAGRFSTSGWPLRSKRMPRGAVTVRSRIRFLSDSSASRSPVKICR